MSRRFIITCLLLALVTGALGGALVVIGLWQLQPGGGLAALTRAQNFILPFLPNDDPDRDGLSNAEEINNKTDPNNPDTDGDGFSDGEEAGRNFNPLKPSELYTDRQPVGFVPGEISDAAARNWMDRAYYLLGVFKNLGVSNRDIHYLALKDWLARKDEVEKKKTEDEQTRLLRAILLAVGGQIPAPPPEDPVKCSLVNKEKCTALLLLAEEEELEMAWEQLQATAAPSEAAELRPMLENYYDTLKRQLGRIMAAEQERNKEDAELALHEIQKLEEDKLPHLYGKLRAAESAIVQKQEPYVER